MIMKDGRFLRPTQTQHIKEKGGGGLGKTHNVHQEALEAEGGEYFPRKDFSKAREASYRSKLALVSKEG